jgi:aryl-alcohol dehydrogenase-like predicted oxidoreductase
MEERKKNNEGLRSMMGNPDQTEQEIKMSEALEKVAGEHGIESVTAVAYVMAKAPYVFPIVGGRKVEHLVDNLQALKIKLTDKQIEYLESIVPFAPGFPNNFVGTVIWRMNNIHAGAD